MHKLKFRDSYIQGHQDERMIYDTVGKIAATPFVQKTKKENTRWLYN